MKRILCIWLPQGAAGRSAESAPFAARGRRAAAAPTALAAEPNDPLAGRLALLQVAEWCQRFSPTVGIDETDPAGTLLLDITGLSGLFGGEANLAEQLLAGLAEERRLWGVAAMADTLGAAWAAAHFAVPALSRAAGSAGFDAAGFASAGASSAALSAAARRRPAPLAIPSGQTAAMLAPLPVAALRLPEEMIGLLAELGVRQIGQVAALPRSSLRSRFGPELLLRYDQAIGLASEVILSARPPAELQARWLLEYPTDRRDLLLLIFEKLLSRLSAALAAERRGALRIEVLLTLQSQPAEHLLIGLFRPSAGLRHWLELLDLQFERRRLSAPVLAVEAAVTATGRLEEIQGALFDEDRSASAGRSLATLVERLASRLGRTAVLRADLLHEAQPEYACRFRPLAGQSVGTLAGSAASARSRGAVQGQPPRVGGARPALLFSPPRRLICQRPPHASQPPRRSAICTAGAVFSGEAAQADDEAARGSRASGPVSFQVRRAQGPERLETGWWRGPSIRRDYYQVETETGAWLWLFRELRSGDWFLHGPFE